MLSSEVFSTYQQQKQAESITKLADLFKSNERAHGVAEVKGSKFNEDKNKWIPANIRLEKTKATEADWYAHLRGERFLGLGPILDDGMVWYATLDVDKLPNSQNYEIDYIEEMGKITRSGFPLVVFKTKSGGLRPTLFFSEPIEADVVISRMKQISAKLGYAGCEIFPKQAKLDVSNEDFASWIFMPYGPEADMFPEQCCLNESGNSMELYDAVIYMEKMKIDRAKLNSLFKDEEIAKANGHANGKRKPQGRWSQDETYELTLGTTFSGGPICLWAIAHTRCRSNQNNFLLSCAVFLKKKYPDNWEEPFGWINIAVLDPPGNAEKFHEMVKRLRNQNYEYGCKDEPMQSHCNPGACRRQPFGVGQGKGGIDHHEMGMTIVNRIPTIYIVNMGEGNGERMMLDANTLLNLQKYKVRCMEHSLSFPNSMKRDEWENIVRKNIDEATRVEPSVLLKTNVEEWESLEKFISGQVKTGVRTRGDEYLNGKWGDYVRVKVNEGKFYFKWESLSLFCGRNLQFNHVRINDLRLFLHNKGEFIPRNKMKGWFRSTWSMRFSQFDPDKVNMWLNPDTETDTEESTDDE
jgi:hypothetical protein